MRIILLLAICVIAFTSCSNKGTSKSFCDTTCTSEPIQFSGQAEWGQTLSISMKNCYPDTITWAHARARATRQIQIEEYLNKKIKINKSSTKALFQDTSMVYLIFNDCVSGRGYLLKMPFSKGKTNQKIISALNSFDPKFSVDPDLVAYTDRGNIFVVNTSNGKEAQMTFKEEYPIDFDNIHTVVDSINVTKQRIFVRLLKEGKEVPFEKAISL